MPIFQIMSPTLPKPAALFFAFGLSVLAFSSPAAAMGGLGEAGEAEAARMHAKAGGPTNYRDAELLARYGCRDSSDSEYCYYLEQRRHSHYGLHKRKYHRD